MRNVMSWKQAIEAGYEPNLYPYTISPGEYTAVLDFKLWAKKTMGVACYFTCPGTGEKFQLTVYRRQRDCMYKLNKSGIDFTTCPTGVAYLISITQNSKGNTSFDDARTFQ